MPSEESPVQAQESPESTSCAGHCRDCGQQHALPIGNAREHARRLMEEFARIQRLDYLAPEGAADPQFGFDRLFAGTQGNMFGVLECEDAQGERHVLRAFSSMPRGIREVAGWVPPILPAEIFHGLVEPERREIEALTAKLETLVPESPAHRATVKERTRRSRALTEALPRHYCFRNFRGVSRCLPEALCHDGRVPGGVGECCAPKLLDHAARQRLRPLGLAEFYWGGPRRAGALRQGQFTAPCTSRCAPLLGFLLCGLEQTP